MTVAELTEHQDAVFGRLAKRERDLDRYAKTIADLLKTDVSSDIDYQRNFNALYGVRRNAQWREAFYKLFENYKDQPDLGFRDVLSELLRATGRVEASFASKLLATVNPKRAIYDSIVRKNLGLPPRASGTTQRIKRLCDDYETIQSHHEKQLARPAYQSLRAKFNVQFPQCQHFSDLKVLDLMIWQMR